MGLKLFESVGRGLTVEEFSMKVEDGWVHLFDGQDVLLSLPQSAWEQLAKSYDKTTKANAKKK